MASNKTPNLGMDVWAETDYFKRLELNSNFDKIDLNLGSLLKKNSWFVSIYENSNLVVNGDWRPAIQKAIDDTKGTKKAVLIPYGIFEISDTLTIYRYTKLIGVGKDLSTIKLANGKNCDVIKTYKFDQYTGSTITGSTEDAVNLDVPIAFEIRDLGIDGNFSNNTAGYGLRIYSKHFTLDNVIVKRCADVGVYTEYGNNFIYKAEDTPETFINLEVHETGGENFIFNGPADISITRLYCGWAGKKYSDSKYFPGEKVHSAVFMKGCEIGETHAFENQYGYAYRFTGSSTRIHADLIIGESAHGCVNIEQGVSFNASKVRAHSNRSNTNPYVLVNSDVGVIISNLDIRKYSSDGTATCLQINKENAKIRGYVQGNSSGGSKGNGVVVNAHHCEVDVNIRYLKSDGATPYYGLVTNPTAFLKRNIITAQIQGCDNAWYNQNQGLGSIYNITLNYNSSQGQTGHSGKPKNEDKETWSIVEEDSATGTIEVSNESVGVYVGYRDFGEADDTGRLQRALDAIVSGGKRKTLSLKPGFTYTISSKLTVDMSYVSIVANGAQIDATAITSGEAINVKGSVAPPFYQSTNKIDGLRVYGAGKATNTVGIKFQGVSTAAAGIAPNASSHLAFYGLNVEKFGTDVYFGSHAYILSFHNCDFFNAGTGLYSPSGTLNSDTDYGENITFNHCAIYSSDLGYEFNNDAGSIMFRDCSIDYNTKMGKSDGSVFILIDGGHIEHRHQGLTQAMFDIKGYSHLTLKNLLFYIINDGYSGTDVPYLFDHSTANGSSELILDNVWLRNIRTTTNRICNGRIKMRNTILQFTNYIQASDTENLARNGGSYESDSNMNTVFNVFIDGDAGTWTNKYNTSNVDVTVDSTTGAVGTKSIKINKKTANASKVQFYFRYKKRGKMAVELQYKKGTATTGTATIKTRLANIGQKLVQDVSAATIMIDSAQENGFLEQLKAIDFTTETGSWVSVKSTSAYQVSELYEYLLVEVDVSSMGVGTMNVDAFVVTEM